MVKATKRMVLRSRGLFNLAMNSIKSYCSMDLGVDLGTCTTIITAAGRGIVLEEPSVVAVNRITKKLSMTVTLLVQLPGRCSARPLSRSLRSVL